METSQKKPQQGSPWRRRLAYGLGTLAVLMAVSWVAVPPLVKVQAEKLASEQLGRKLSMGSIDFKPWTLELEIKDIKLAQSDGQSEQLRIGRAYANAELQSILRFAPVVDALEIEGVRAQLVHLGDGKYDIDDIMARVASKSKPSKSAGDELPKFAIFNIALKDWSLQFDDRSVGKRHSVRDFQLSLPFLSTLPSQRTVKTEPYLAFDLNGSRFDSKGETTPFVQSHKTDAKIRIKDLDLAPYLPYVKPLLKGLPFQPVGAVFGADLNLAFEQNPSAIVRLSGSVDAQNVALDDFAGKRLLDIKRVSMKVRDVQPLAALVALDELEIDAPQLQLKRDAAGRLNVDAAPSTRAKAQKGETKSAESTTGEGQVRSGSVDPKATPKWKFSLDRLKLNEGGLAWTDEANKPTAKMLVSGLQFQATQIALPFSPSEPQAVPFEGAASMDQAQFTFTGSATDAKASVSAQISGFPLVAMGAYVQALLQPSVAGTLDAQVELLWQARQAKQSGALQVAVPKAQVAKVLLSREKSKLLQLQSLGVQNAQIDLIDQSLKLQKVSVSGLQTRIERSAAGRWMVQDWLREGTPTPAGQASASNSSPAWKLSLGEIDLDAPRLGFVDRQASSDAIKPVALDVGALKLRAFGIEAHGSDLGQKPIRFDLSLNVAQGDAAAEAPPRVANDAAPIKLRGQVVPAPLAVQLEGQVQRFPVHALEPYFGSALNVDVLKLDASYNGKLQITQRPAGMAANLQGDVVLEDLQTTLRSATLAAASGAVAGDELISWRALSLNKLALETAPAAAMKIDVGEAALTDFFARILISEQGRLNLADIVKSSSGTTTAVVSAATAAAQPRTASQASSNAASQTVAISSIDPIIQIGQTSLINGKVFFADRFIKPNYAANLSELTGRLGAFSSQPRDGVVQMAALELRGKAEGTAQLEILGQLNPLAKPLALDITGKVRDLELAPLTPYSVKYAGHGIERGKLSVDVKYLVKPDGQLTASNNIILNQLRFGDKVEGAPNSLPVKLAVALLADRNGVIDINLPVQGSLNDPQFSIGPIVFKLIVNLVVKAITSPFSLLASAFGGGGDELGQVAFSAGSAQLAEGSKPALEKVIKALQDRPALKMTVIGEASIEAEREGYKKERLKSLVAAEKRRRIVTSGSSSNATQTLNVSVTEAEYPILLKEVYRRSDVSKPRNAIGLVKDIPAPEMEALLLASLPVTEQGIQELATARGIAVRDYLSSKGLPSDKLFLGAPKTVAKEDKWTPRAQLSLTAQ